MLGGKSGSRGFKSGNALQSYASRVTVKECIQSRTVSAFFKILGTIFGIRWESV